MRTEVARVGARGIDSLPFSIGGTRSQADRLKASGVDFAVLYLGSVTPKIVGDVISAGLAFMPVTFAGAYFNGADDELSQLKRLGLPLGCTVWLDLEGKKSYETPPQELIAKCDAWALAVQKAGYEAGLYIGSPQPLTADELYRLRVTRYWKAPSRVIDRLGKASDGPACGFCMYQLWPSVMWPSASDPERVFVDVNFVQQDHQGRVPHWVVGA
jgi:hypothetical protein